MIWDHIKIKRLEKSNLAYVDRIAEIYRQKTRGEEARGELEAEIARLKKENENLRAAGKTVQFQVNVRWEDKLGPPTVPEILDQVCAAIAKAKEGLLWR